MPAATTTKRADGLMKTRGITSSFCFCGGQEAQSAAAGRVASTTMRRIFRRTLLLSPFVLSLASCGRGDGGGQDDPPILTAADIVVNDMRLLNDFKLKGYESFKHGWYVGPGFNNMGNNPSFSNSPTWSDYYNNPMYVGKVAHALLPWVAVFDGVDHTASNVAIEIRNMRTYIMSSGTSEWKSLGHTSHTTGSYFGKQGVTVPVMNEEVVARSPNSSTIKIPEYPGYFWHGWANSGIQSIDPDDIGAIHVTVEARLVSSDESKVYDVDKAEIGLQVGADYYLDKNYKYPANAPSIGISRTKRVTADWQSFSFTTFSDVGKQDPGGGISEAFFRSNPPPSVASTPETTPVKSR